MIMLEYVGCHEPPAVDLAFDNFVFISPVELWMVSGMKEVYTPQLNPLQPRYLAEWHAWIT